jgi:hypothetical protein
MKVEWVKISDHSDDMCTLKGVDSIHLRTENMDKEVRFSGQVERGLKTDLSSRSKVIRL